MYRNLILLSVSLFAWGIGESAYIYFQPLYLEELGASPILIGGIIGAVGIAMSIVHIPAGYLADRIDRRNIIWASWALGVLSAGLMVTAKSLTLFVTGMIIYGFTAFVASPLNSYVTNVRGNLSIGRVLTLTAAVYNLGAIIGPFVGGRIGNYFNLHAIYIFSLIAYSISFLIILQIQSQPTVSSKREDSVAVIKNKKYITFLLLVFFATFTMYLPYPLTPVYLRNIKNISLQKIGILGSLGSFGNATLSLILGSFSPYIGVVLGQLFVAIFSLAIWKGNNIYWFALGFFLYGGFRAAMGLATALSNKFASGSNMGLIYGFTATVSTISVILAPPLAGYLYEQSPSWLYLASIVFGLISILFWVSARKMGVNNYDKSVEQS